MSYKAQPLVLHDSPGCARALISTFYKNPQCALMWPNLTRREITRHYLRRLPDNLVGFRDIERHVKVVHTATGEVVGYSRWLFPTRLLGLDRLGSALFWDQGRIEWDARGSPLQSKWWQKDETEWTSATMDAPSSEINKKLVKALAPSLELEGTAVQVKTDCLRGFRSSFQCLYSRYKVTK